MKKLDVFIQGELVNLCVPTLEYARESDWYSWFNDPKTTRFLDQGIWPNTPEKQVEFLESAQKSRLSLVVSVRGKYVGVVSLSSINWQKGWAEIAIVLSQKKIKDYNKLIPLEAMARLTEHGFLQMNLQRISAGQHILLSSWQQRLELIGYRLEGIKHHGFVKGSEKEDAVWIAVTADQYSNLVSKRGDYWDSAKKMEKRVERLPKKSYFQKLSSFVGSEGEKYYQNILEL